MGDVNKATSMPTTKPTSRPQDPCAAFRETVNRWYKKAISPNGHGKTNLTPTEGNELYRQIKGKIPNTFTCFVTIGDDHYQKFGNNIDHWLPHSYIISRMIHKAIKDCPAMELDPSFFKDMTAKSHKKQTTRSSSEFTYTFKKGSVEIVIRNYRSGHFFNPTWNEFSYTALENGKERPLSNRSLSLLISHIAKLAKGMEDAPVPTNINQIKPYYDDNIRRASLEHYEKLFRLWKKTGDNPTGFRKVEEEKRKDTKRKEAMKRDFADLNDDLSQTKSLKGAEKIISRLEALRRKYGLGQDQVKSPSYVYSKVFSKNVNAGFDVFNSDEDRLKNLSNRELIELGKRAGISIQKISQTIKQVSLLLLFNALETYNSRNNCPKLLSYLKKIEAVHGKIERGNNNPSANKIRKLLTTKINQYKGESDSIPEFKKWADNYKTVLNWINS